MAEDGGTATIVAEFHALTAERWPDLERLFVERGACAGCWCMFFRQTRPEFERRKGAGNRAAFRSLVEKIGRAHV